MYLSFGVTLVSRAWEGLLDVFQFPVECLFPQMDLFGILAEFTLQVTLTLAAAGKQSQCLKREFSCASSPGAGVSCPVCLVVWDC